MDIRITVGEKKEVHGIRYWTDTFHVRSTIVFLRAYDNKELVGQVGIDEEDWIVFLVVKPDCRGRGIGTKLLHEAEDYIQNRGGVKSKIRPQLESQERLIKWYERLGYRLFERLDDGNVNMEKDL